VRGLRPSSPLGFVYRWILSKVWTVLANLSANEVRVDGRWRLDKSDHVIEGDLPLS